MSKLTDEAAPPLWRFEDNQFNPVGGGLRAHMVRVDEVVNGHKTRVLNVVKVDAFYQRADAREAVAAVNWCRANGVDTSNPEWLRDKIVTLECRWWTPEERVPNHEEMVWAETDHGLFEPAYYNHEHECWMDVGYIGRLNVVRYIELPRPEAKETN